MIQNPPLPAVQGLLPFVKPPHVRLDIYRLFFREVEECGVPVDVPIHIQCVVAPAVPLSRHAALVASGAFKV